MVFEKIRYSAPLLVPAFIAVSALVACTEDNTAPPAAPPPPPMAPPPGPVAMTPPPAPPAPIAPAAPVMAPPVVVSNVGLAQPESALYDADTDVYLLSNIQGTPADADGKAFISKITPDGKVLDLKWIDGSKKGTTLNAPKGLGISKGVLYVADITFVRTFDAKTGAPKGKIAVPGSTFLNDIAVASDGTVYVSDSGIKPGKDNFEPTGTDAIYSIGKNGAAKKLIANKELAGPNGLLADDTGVWCVTFGSGELYHVGKDGKKDQAQKLPQGALDGIVKTADGSILISSWQASGVFKGTPGGTFELALKDTKSPADIGYDTKRNSVLIPEMQVDSLVIQALPGGAPAPAAAPAAMPGPTAPATPTMPAAKPASSPPASPPPPAAAPAMSGPMAGAGSSMKSTAAAPAAPAAPAPATAPAK